MNYKVLYRKYRPTNFENIIGQEYIVKTLKNSIMNKNISHAYIFSGPRGTGKTSTAKVFSKAINCINHHNGSPCENCEFCVNFLENPDIIEIDAASNNGVDEIRGLIDNIKLTPTNGKYKIYIIDEVHMLTTSAFNALLLTLEEPPSHAIFILATTNIESVPITILSRCQRYDFQKITVDNLVKGLKTVCDKENISIEDDALTEIAYLSEGGMRDALSLLDQLSKNGQIITLDLVEKQVKTISKKGINDLIDTLEQNDVEKCLAILNDYSLRSIDYKSLIKKIIDAASTRAKNIKKGCRINRLTFHEYKNLIINLSECLVKINVNVNPYTIIEMILLEFFEVSSIQNSKENGVNVKVTATGTKTNVRKNEIGVDLIKIRINNCFVNAQKSHLETAKKIINKLISSINIDGKIKSIFVDSNVVAASDKYVILTCISEHSADNANNLLSDLEKVITKECSESYKLVFVSESRWEKEKKSYILNLKANRHYEYIEEKDNTEESTEPIISDVFDMAKVEII